MIFFKRLLLVFFSLITVIILWSVGYEERSFVEKKAIEPNIQEEEPFPARPVIQGDKIIRFAAQSSQDRSDRLKTVEGFSVSVFATELGAPRVLMVDSRGVLLASVPSEGKILALPDRNADGKADEVVVLAAGLNRPHGLALKGDNQLYVAETDKVTVFDYDANAVSVNNPRKILDLSTGGRHTTKTIMFLPGSNQERLLIASGSSCNVCVEQDSRRGTIMIANADGSELRVFASGLRNSVFMTDRPGTNEVWATEMGRDFLGDNLPPDEINIIEEGNFYGWPYAYGKQVQDRTFNAGEMGRQRTAISIPSHIDIPAHSAPLGLAFMGSSWGDSYEGSLLVAYHGSWNRSVPTGYKVVRYLLDENGRVNGQEDFVYGWADQAGSISGRPAGIWAADNAIYIADDQGGNIYLIKKINN